MANNTASKVLALICVALFSGILAPVKMVHAETRPLSEVPRIEDIFKCEGKLTTIPRLNQEQIRAILMTGENPLKIQFQVRRALTYMLEMKNPTQLQLAMMWERFVPYMIRFTNSGRHWNSYRTIGLGGVIYYEGNEQHFIAITPSIPSKIFKGLRDVNDDPKFVDLLSSSYTKNLNELKWTPPELIMAKPK
jgi:hypothetical protein